jgi:sugar lactone lactonase YvrE
MVMRYRRFFLAVVIGLLASLPIASDVGAQPATGTVVASGLSSPRYLAILDDGSILVSEAGAGGTEKLPSPPDSAGPPGDLTRGKTGQVTKISATGAKTIVASGLPSYGSGEGATGPAGIAWLNGVIYLANGNAVPPGNMALSYEGQVVRIDSSGAITKVADLAANEAKNNPDGTAINSDLYGMAAGPDGMLYVADAAGNVLYQVNPGTGAFRVVAVFPGLPGDGPNPDRGGKNEVDPVPTGVAVAPDGTIYVSYLGGGAPTPGRAKVVKVSSNGTVSDAVTGLTYATGVAVGPDGLLYVSKLTQGLDTSKQPPAPKPGGISRVLADGSMQIVADNLMAPNGIAFDKAGNLYVTVGTIDPKNGQVLKLSSVAAPKAVAPPTATTPSITTPPGTATGGTSGVIQSNTRYYVRKLGDG